MKAMTEAENDKGDDADQDKEMTDESSENLHMIVHNEYVHKLKPSAL